MFSILIALAAASTPFENLAILDERIQVHVADAEPVDKRLKLAQCPDSPIIAPPVGGVVVVRCPAIGWRLRVPVRAPAEGLETVQIIIRKGDMVECIAGGPGFAVSTQMIALDDAFAGQPLRVKSMTSAVPMTAIAMARGVATF